MNSRPLFRADYGTIPTGANRGQAVVKARSERVLPANTPDRIYAQTMRKVARRCAAALSRR